MDPPPPPSPLLPWEVIERIISHLDPDETWWAWASIRNFSLTCRELRPRSLYFLVVNARFSSRNRIFDFCDFLRANSHLKPFVRSIAVDPRDFAPVPLLRILPNLPKIEFASLNPEFVSPDLNQSILTSCRLLGTCIQTLSLSHFHFATSLHFFRVLSAFPSMTHLVCWDVGFGEEGDPASVFIAQRRLRRRLQLRTLISSTDYYHLNFAGPLSYNATSVGTVLINSGLVSSTIESLDVEVSRLSGLSQKFDWPRLRSLTLKLESKQVVHGIVFLKDFHHPNLKEVTVEICEWDLASIPGNLTHHANIYTELEHTLLGFSHARLVWSIYVRPISRNSFWVQELAKRLPALSRRNGALTVVPSEGFDPRHGYLVGQVHTCIISPDSKWVASGYKDLVTLWNTANGVKVQLWAPYGVTSTVHLILAFSPNSQHLVSGAGPDGHEDKRTVIWDLGGGVHQVLEGHTKSVTACAWSPGGNIIASGSYDATVWLWDTHTFHPLHVLQHALGGKVELVKFSPDGHWLLTGCDSRSYYLWDVVSGMGQQLRAPITDASSKINIAAAFDPGSTRFVIISPRLGGMVEILDTEGIEGSCYVVLGASGSLGGETKNVAFSPDGNLVLTVPNYRVKTHAIRIWDAYTGVQVLSLEGHEDQVLSACFSPCGKYVASVSKDRTVRLWRTRDGSCVTTLSEHTEWVTQVVFSPDGKTLVSGGHDGSVIIRQMCNVLPIDEQDS